jgi:hypothetical protein
MKAIPTAVLDRAAALDRDSKNLRHSQYSRNACITELNRLGNEYGVDFRAPFAALRAA